MKTLLPLHEISVPERFRRDYGDLSTLKASISVYGLILPIVVNEAKVLIDGGRRFRACTELGMVSVPVIFYETMDETQRRELELEANLHRKDHSWQELVLATEELHKLRSHKAILAGDTWTMRIAAEVFGMNLSDIGKILTIAKYLHKEKNLPPGKREFWNYQSCSEAYRLGHLGIQLRLAEAKLAERHKALASTPQQQQETIALLAEVKAITATPDSVASAKATYEANVLNVIPFDQFLEEKVSLANEAANTVYLSFLNHCDCIEYMQQSSGMFDAIITDIPYGIDMDNLKQGGPEGDERIDLEETLQEHDVAENMSLMAKFFPAAWQTLKEKAFLITYCDFMQWQYMYDLAIKAGFHVQRWPLIWPKTQAMNQYASTNTTKDYEILMVCSKPGTVIVSQPNTSIGPRCSSRQARLDTKHQFAKPYEMTEWLAKTFTAPHSLIIDPFAGGGSIVVQLRRMERIAHGVEKKEIHYNAMLATVQNFYRSLNPKVVFK